MDNRSNTIAGWVLFAGICALGLSIGSGMYFASHEPHTFGLPVEAAEESGGGAAEVPFANLLAKADLAHGETIFAKCSACHTITQGGPNGIGPNLWGTVGEEIGHGKQGFDFSAVIAAHGGTWTFDNLDQWLTSPRKFAPGTKMSFAGLSSGQDRADVIAYLNAQGSNLPLPPPVAVPAAADAATGDAAAAPAAGEAAAPAATGATAPADAAAAPAAPAAK